MPQKTLETCDKRLVCCHNNCDELITLDTYCKPLNLFIYGENIFILYSHITITLVLEEMIEVSKPLKLITQATPSNNSLSIWETSAPIMKVSFRAYESHCVCRSENKPRHSWAVVFEPIICFDLGNTSLPFILVSFVRQLNSQFPIAPRESWRLLMTADYLPIQRVEGASRFHLWRRRRACSFISIFFFIKFAISNAFS